MNKARAPWTAEQVANLERRQAVFHPYTCQVHGSAPLVPTYAGWVCPDPICEYTQKWAFEMDANVPEWWVTPVGELKSDG